MYVLFFDHGKFLFTVLWMMFSVVSGSIKVPYQLLFLTIKVEKMKIKLQKKKKKKERETIVLLKKCIVECMLMSSSEEFITSYHMHQITVED